MRTTCSVHIITIYLIILIVPCVRMKRIQSKKIISQKLSGLCHRKGKLKAFLMPGLRACAATFLSPCGQRDGWEMDRAEVDLT
jgi:hypothetical protein